MFSSMSTFISNPNAIILFHLHLLFVLMKNKCTPNGKQRETVTVDDGFSVDLGADSDITILITNNCVNSETHEKNNHHIGENMWQ